MGEKVRMTGKKKQLPQAKQPMPAPQKNVLFAPEINVRQYNPSVYQCFFTSELFAGISFIVVAGKFFLAAFMSSLYFEGHFIKISLHSK